MAIYDLRKKTQASTGQRTIKDESSCNCSEMISKLQKEVEELKKILKGTNNGQVTFIDE
tara:strand:- start:42 stop:218 length:177 start_codon:yes stop_codon:yes gene_type:complete